MTLFARNVAALACAVALLAGSSGALGDVMVVPGPTSFVDMRVRGNVRVEHGGFMFPSWCEKKHRAVGGDFPGPTDPPAAGDWTVDGSALALIDDDNFSRGRSFAEFGYGYAGLRTDLLVKSRSEGFTTSESPGDGDFFGDPDDGIAATPIESEIAGRIQMYLASDDPLDLPGPYNVTLVLNLSGEGLLESGDAEALMSHIIRVTPTDPDYGPELVFNGSLMTPPNITPFQAQLIVTYRDVPLVPDSETPVALVELGMPFSVSPDCGISVGVPGLFTSVKGRTDDPDIFTSEAFSRFDTTLSLRLNAQRASEPSTLFADTFDVSANSNDVNFEHDMGRQSGILAPATYFEEDSTATGGTFDHHTQVDNPSLPDTLRMVSDAPAGPNTAVVSPNQNFLVPGFEIQHYHVELNPAGPGHEASDDVWAGFNFGSTQGTVFFDAKTTGVLVRPDGGFSVFDNGTEVANGGLTPKGETEFYSIDVDVDFRSGAWSLAIDDAPIAAGIHGEYSTNYLNLTYYSSTASTGQQIGHFDNLLVTGMIPEPLALPGDFNKDGVVDAADYAVWRKLLGQVGPLLAADHTGLGGIPDGTVDQLDFNLWRANFGETLGAGAGSRMRASGVATADPAVPEASALALWLLGGQLLVTRRLARFRSGHP